MSGRCQKIWITRAQPGADATAERVRALGHEAVIAPLLRVRHLPDAQLDLEGVAALAFTSANGARAFAELSGDRSLKVFAVGAATALAARQAGFRTVLSADGDVAALAAGIASRLAELGGVVLHPCAAEPAGDLVGALEAVNTPARRVVVYETTPIILTPDEVSRLLACDAVLLHSPRAAKILLGLLKIAPAPHLRALALSKDVIKPLARADLGAKLFPPFPLEAALLNLIDRKS